MTKPDQPSRILPSLAGAFCVAGPSVSQVLVMLGAANGQARIVGGAVRDTLLGRFSATKSDVDIATTLRPEEVMAAARSAGIKAVPTGVEHGTVTLVVAGRGIEVTTLRRDVETDGRRAVVAFTDDWSEDAMRRDFTMNALYADGYGTLFDPLGGYDDLINRRVRFIGQAQTRIEEDALRILRFFRFQAEIAGAEMDHASYSACVANGERLSGLSRERVRHELLRLLASPGAMLAIEAMDRGGLIAALGLGEANLGRLQRFMALDGKLGREAGGTLRLGALCLSGEKTTTASTMGTEKGLGERLRLSTAETRQLAALEAVSPVAITAQMNRHDLNQLCHHFGKKVALEKFQFAWANSDATLDDDIWADLWQQLNGIELPAFPLSGADLVAAGLEPGPDLGKKLKQLEGLWVQSDFTMSSADLKALIDKA